MSATDTFECSICRELCTGWSNNAAPVNDGRCCGDCNDMIVIPMRLAFMRRSEEAAKIGKPLIRADDRTDGFIVYLPNGDFAWQASRQSAEVFAQRWMEGK